MKTFEQMQKEYAELIVCFWLNLQKGQNLLIKAPMEAVEFVKLVAKAAYQAWAQEIFYRRGNEELDLIKYQYAPEEVFDTVPQWIEDGYVNELKNNCAQLSLYAGSRNLEGGWSKEGFSPYAGTSKIKTWIS